MFKIKPQGEHPCGLWFLWERIQRIKPTETT